MLSLSSFWVPINLLKIDHVTIGARQPQSQHTLTLKECLLQFWQIYFAIWTNNFWKLNLKIDRVTIGAWRPQHTFALNSFIFKQFRNARWISIQARLDHYTTISNWFHQNMHQEYFSMCNACWVDPKMLNRDEQYSIQYRLEMNMQTLILPIAHCLGIVSNVAWASWILNS